MSTSTSFTDRILQTQDKQQIVSLLFQFLKEKGQNNYDERVTQYQHAIQTAFLAMEEKAPESLVVAALLHDIGHLVADEKHAMENFRTEDLFHEEVAADFLNELFPASVIDPIRLHVPAKRYICTKDKNYLESLSNASKRSFQLQGGFMSEEVLAEFEKEPFYKDATRLRKWDDDGKVQQKQVPEIEMYAAVVEKLLL